MKTLKTLRELLPDIMQHIFLHLEYLRYNDRLMLVHEGQLRAEIEKSLRAELGDKAYAKAIKRVPSINLLVRIIDKLSRVYTEAAVRTATNDADGNLIEYYEEALDLISKMPSANRMLNLHKCVALEPFLEEGKPSLRVIPANQFLVFSDSLTSPDTMTVFIKLMGREMKQPLSDDKGRYGKTSEPYAVDIYLLYSDTEIIVVDSDGMVRADKMHAWGIETGVNPIGCIPFVYLNRSQFRLIPIPDNDTLDNTVLIPKLLADLNYAVQFQSHSIVVTTDLNVPADVPWNPDVILNLKTDEGAEERGTVQTIKPTVDIEQVLKLIETTLSLWLESRNIKSTGASAVTAEAAASGVAKIVDQADASQDRVSQVAIFERAEARLWKLLTKLHTFWLETKQLADIKPDFTKEFAPSFRFPELAPVTSERERVEAAGLKLEKGLIDKRGALKEINPYMKDEELDALEVAVGASKVSLNGAQLAELTTILTAAAAGQLPRDSTQELLVQAFSMPVEVADKILGSIGKGFHVEQPQGPANAASGAGKEPEESGDAGGSGSGDDSGADAGAGAGSSEA